jgi:vacuolar-type H+-ATPase subunit H
MERVLSMSGRLQKLLTEAQAEAEKIVQEAQRQADEMINIANKEAERKRIRAQRGTGLEELLAEEEKKAMKEADKITKDYKNQVEDLKKVSEKKVSNAIDFVMKEVLPE